MDYHDELINEIAADVLTVLARRRFFEMLDDRMCPSDPNKPRVVCQGDLASTTIC